MFCRSIHRLGRKDFDAWAYHLSWSGSRGHPSSQASVKLVVEDIKFAYNAWSLLRLASFYDLGQPKVLSNLNNTQPSMNIAFGGNRLFHLHTEIGKPLNPKSVKVALTPDHPKAIPLQSFPWRETIGEAFQQQPGGDGGGGIELVLGMENGLSQTVADQCDHFVYIAQYGSIGSLSMLSALAIATHVTVGAARLRPSSSTDVPALVPTQGHMPQSNHAMPVVNPRPHETDLLDRSDAEIRELLRIRRAEYPLQLSLLIYNDLSDRNIGAIMRNANVFNCDKLVLLNRRKFNRRGAVGTHRLLDTQFFSGTRDADFSQSLEGYEIWLLYQYYPYLLTYSNDDDATFIRHDDPRLAGYLATGHALSPAHPVAVNHPHLLEVEPVLLDDTGTIRAALESVKARGLKGVMIAVPEEGCAPHPDIAALSHRVMYVTSPSRVNNDTQRGLNGALSTAVALERLRSCIDTLSL